MESLPSVLRSGGALRNSQEQAESLCVKIRDRTNRGQLVVRLYYRLPVQEEPFDEAFICKLKEVSHSKVLILMGDFN